MTKKNLKLTKNRTKIMKLEELIEHSFGKTKKVNTEDLYGINTTEGKMLYNEKNNKRRYRKILHKVI